MEAHGVVPDVVDVAPKDVVRVSYDGGQSAANGNELTPTQVRNHPVDISWPVEEDVLYTLCLTDPDAPSREDFSWREFQHYLVVNIPGTDVSKGQVLHEYVGSGPPKGSGIHRYVWLVYKQPAELKCDEPRLSSRSAEGRPMFSTRNFAAKYRLGQPVAANFYLAQWDDYVPELHKQLGVAL